MFGLSFPELVVVLIVALVVLGPERLPKLAKTIGKTMRDVRRTTSEFKDMVEGEFSAIEREVEGKPERKGGVPDGVAALPAVSGASAISHAVPALRPAGAVPATEAAVHRADEATLASAHAVESTPAAGAREDAVTPAVAHTALVGPAAATAVEAVESLEHRSGSTAPAARADDRSAVPAIAGAEGTAASPKDA